MIKFIGGVGEIIDISNGTGSVRVKDGGGGCFYNHADIERVEG